MSYPDPGSATIPPAGPPEQPKSAGLSITALVLGVLGFLVITIPISIIIGIIALVKKTQKLKVLAVVGIVLSILWIVGYGVAIVGGVGFFATKVANADVKVGDCVTQDKSTNLVAVVPCDQPNEGKVYATPELGTSSTFPGDSKTEADAKAACEKALPAGTVNYKYLPPSEAQWQLGQHKAFCLVAAK
jgi:hypothetical protein